MTCFVRNESIFDYTTYRRLTTKLEIFLKTIKIYFFKNLSRDSFKLYFFIYFIVIQFVVFVEINLSVIFSQRQSRF